MPRPNIAVSSHMWVKEFIEDGDLPRSIFSLDDMFMIRERLLNTNIIIGVKYDKILREWDSYLKEYDKYSNQYDEYEYYDLPDGFQIISKNDELIETIGAISYQCMADNIIDQSYDCTYVKVSKVYLGEVYDEWITLAEFDERLEKYIRLKINSFQSVSKDKYLSTVDNEEFKSLDDLLDHYEDLEIKKRHRELLEEL